MFAQTCLKSVGLESNPHPPHKKKCQNLSRQKFLKLFLFGLVKIPKFLSKKSASKVLDWGQTPPHQQNKCQNLSRQKFLKQSLFGLDPSPSVLLQRVSIHVGVFQTFFWLIIAFVTRAYTMSIVLQIGSGGKLCFQHSISIAIAYNLI